MPRRRIAGLADGTLRIQRPKYEGLGASRGHGVERRSTRCQGVPANVTLLEMVDTDVCDEFRSIHQTIHKTPLHARRSR